MFYFKENPRFARTVNFIKNLDRSPSQQLAASFTSHYFLFPCLHQTGVSVIAFGSSYSSATTQEHFRLFLSCCSFCSVGKKRKSSSSQGSTVVLRYDQIGKQEEKNWKSRNRVISISHIAIGGPRRFPKAAAFQRRYYGTTVCRILVLRIRTFSTLESNIFFSLVRMSHLVCSYTVGV